MPGKLRQVWRNIAVYAWNHPWAKRDRLGTYLRILGWQLRTAFDRTPQEVAWVNGARLCVKKGQAGLTGNIYYGLHEFIDMAFFCHFLRPGDVFADIGANGGSYTVLAAKVAGAHVHAFEPAKETQGTLNANIALNGIADQVELHPVALGREEGERRFTVGRDATNCFAENDDPSASLVSVQTADSALCDKGVVAMKVDVELAEDQVFAGARNLLQEPQLAAIEVETLMDGVREVIEDAGFSERWYDPDVRDLRAAPGQHRSHNHLFVRNEDLVLNRLRTAESLHYGKLTA